MKAGEGNEDFLLREWHSDSEDEQDTKRRRLRFCPFTALKTTTTIRQQAEMHLLLNTWPLDAALENHHLQSQGLLRTLTSLENRTRQSRNSNSAADNPRLLPFQRL